MLYKKNKETSLSDSLFKNPTSEYRGAPFWAWNSYLTKDELCRQIEIFKEMGLGGFHMHVRTGLKNEYLSDEYMQLVSDCAEKAKKEKMLAWAYDEDRWPSGAAGGLVTKDEKYRARSLLFTPFKVAEAYSSDDSRSEGGRSENGKLLACYDVQLDSDGFLSEYKRIDENDEAKGTKWYAFLEINTPSSWYNDQTYVDTLSKEAIEKFIEVTHERYKEKVGSEFGETIPAIFTDEPQFARKQVMNNSFDEMDVNLPWTDKVPELYKEAYGEDIFATLPELFWDLPDSAPSIHRYRYHDFIAELFASSFADTVGSWCDKNGIALTGHMMEEPTLHSQTAALGEAMRSYRSFGLPGIDLLCSHPEFTTAKQAQSATHQFGKEGVLSELYGVTGWDCDFRTYKQQGDWQAALGITVRVPHLSWYSMEGEAKRDYPASIHYQSPWYKEYRIVEDHFARVNTALTRGKPVIKVAVIHPVESFWLHWGPNDKSAVLRESLNEKFENITKWLLEGSIDFNFISESLLPSLCSEGGFPLKVGKMEYDAIVVPGCETLRATTLERLEKFREDGGKLIFMGEAPSLCDAVKSDRGEKLYNKSIRTDFTRAGILGELESERTLTLRYANGRLTDRYFYQLRQDNDCRWLFIAQDCFAYNNDLISENDIQIILKGEYVPEVYDTSNGEIYPINCTYRDGQTIIRKVLYDYETLLLKLTDGRKEAAAECEKKEFEFKPVCEKVGYSLSEDNVYLLDMAEYKLAGDSEFSAKEEILRLDNILRTRLGIRTRGGGIVQPWVYGEKEPITTLTLRFKIESEIEYSGAYLALETADKAEIVFNSQTVDNTTCGYFTDLSISKVKLPDIMKGENILEVTLPIGESTNTENMFILGKFGVECIGRSAKIVPLPEKIAFSDLTHQGFPFYGAAVTYKFKAEAKGGALAVRASQYRGAVIGVKVDGIDAGRIVYPPYTLTVEGIEDGEHEVELTLYIHRYNCFGPLHLVNVKESWHGPGAWRSSDENWTYEYVLRPTGIMRSPETN